MSMEIECKIHDMSIAEFLTLGRRIGLEPEVGKLCCVTDEYWFIPSLDSLIRYRTERFCDDNTSRTDLTIKGEEENDGKFTSERSEVILRLDSASGITSVQTFLQKLGGTLSHTVHKHRTFFVTNDSELRIHHDVLVELRDNGRKVEWVEIEVPTRVKLQETVMRLLGVEARDRVSNRTTLDIVLSGVAKK